MLPKGETSTCNQCGYAGDRFHPSNPTVCKNCLADRQRKYRKKRTPEYWQTKDRKYTIKKLYGLSVEDVEAMDARQGGVCAICATPPTSAKYLHIDHCHSTGKVRGLLCNGCNRALGFINDRPEVAEAAARYLRHHRDSNVDIAGYAGTLEMVMAEKERRAKF